MTARAVNKEANKPTVLPYIILPTKKTKATVVMSARAEIDLPKVRRSTEGSPVARSDM